MPVIGIPIVVTPSTATVAAPTTAIFGVPAVERIKSLRLAASSANVVAWTMVDAAGDPIDLTEPLGDGATASLRALESIDGRYPAEFAATAPDAAAGKLEAVVDAQAIGAPGVYLAEFVVRAGAGAVIYANRFYLVLDPGLFADCAASGPPSIAEVRLAIRDSAPAEAQLIDSVTFDDAEIAQALRFCVAYFNEITPPLSRSFDTTNFPSRYHWCKGAAGQLFATIAEYYRKNQLQYAAGGVAVDDFAKAPLYDAAADRYWAEYTTWAKQTKYRMAQDECWGSADSPYSVVAGFGGAWRQY